MQVGPLTYTQSYLYVGIASSILMSMFSSFMPPISAHFLMGILALLLATLGMKLSFRIKNEWPLFLIYFPVAFSVIRDGSPARLTIIVFAFLPFLYRRVSASSGFRRLGLWLLLNSLILLTIEDKPFIVYLAPGIFVIILSQDVIKGQGNSIRWVLTHSALFGSLFTFSLVFLLVARQNGQMYLTTLAESNASRTGIFLLFSLLTAVLHIFSWYAFAVRFVDINYDPLREQPQFYEALPWGSGLATGVSLVAMAVTAVMMVYLLFSLSRSSLRHIRASQQPDENSLLLASVFLLFFVPVLGGAWTSHHFVFAHMIILTLVIRNNEKFIRLRPFMLIPALSVITALSLTMFPHRSYNSEDSRAVIDRAIQLATPSDIINCAYSCYFEYSLRNEDNIPITFAITDADLVKLVSNYSREKRVFHICKECKDDNNFSAMDLQAKLLVQEGEWSLFQINKENEF